jgi:hypothetical protein
MNPVSVLCFGNSLTQGFPINHPYAIALSDTLRNNFPNIPFAIDVQGLPGDQVVSPPGSYLPRLDILCKFCVFLIYAALMCSAQRFEIYISR